MTKCAADMRRVLGSRPGVATVLDNCAALNAPIVSAAQLARASGRPRNGRQALSSGGEQVARTPTAIGTSTSPARRHAAAIDTFANRRNQYVPIGNVTASPSCQQARATA
jgi:hypothetical protein